MSFFLKLIFCTQKGGVTGRCRRRWQQHGRVMTELRPFLLSRALKQFCPLQSRSATSFSTLPMAMVLPETQANRNNHRTYVSFSSQLMLNWWHSSTAFLLNSKPRRHRSLFVTIRWFSELQENSRKSGRTIRAGKHVMNILLKNQIIYIIHNSYVYNRLSLCFLARFTRGQNRI